MFGLFCEFEIIIELLCGAHNLLFSLFGVVMLYYLQILSLSTGFVCLRTSQCLSEHWQNDSLICDSNELESMKPTINQCLKKGGGGWTIIMSTIRYHDYFKFILLNYKAGYLKKKLIPD